MYSAGTFTGTVTQGWEALLSSGAEINVGLILSSSTATFLPASFRVNGASCTVILSA